ncbi:dTDP-4-dehydrorhamnose 3,5-epimerase family protein [Streptomyces sp. NPDC001414]
MDAKETRIPGAFVFTPRQIHDERGAFAELLRCDRVEEATGRPFRPAQINSSVSRRNTLRGVHSVITPPGQAKYVTCVRGAVRDIIVDLRVGSPAFGVHHVVLLDPEAGRCLYVPEGVGHGFLALTDDSCVCYAVSTQYVPGTQIEIDPFDPELALPWGHIEPPVMSEKDAQAQKVRAALDAGLLANWRDVTAAIPAGRQ